MGSTALTLVNNILNALGESEMLSTDVFSSQRNFRKTVINSLQWSLYDVINDIEFPQLETESQLTILENVNYYTLPTDLWQKKLKYLYVLDSYNQPDGIIRILTPREYRKFDEEVTDGYLSAYPDGSYLYFTDYPTSDNPTFEPDTTVDATSAALGTTLYVADTTGFSDDMVISIGAGTVRSETNIIDSITSGVSFTLKGALTYEHTLAQADAVSAAYKVKLVYQKTPTALTTSANTCDLPSEFDPLLIYKTLSKCYGIKEQFNLSQYYDTMYSKFRKDVKKSILAYHPKRLKHFDQMRQYTGDW